MTIYQAMVAIDMVSSYIYVRADNMSQAFELRPYANKR
jgi:hypothetical protein